MIARVVTQPIFSRPYCITIGWPWKGRLALSACYLKLISRPWSGRLLGIPVYINTTVCLTTHVKVEFVSVSVVNCRIVGNIPLRRSQSPVVHLSCWYSPPTQVTEYKVPPAIVTTVDVSIYHDLPTHAAHHLRPRHQSISHRTVGARRCTS